MARRRSTVRRAGRPSVSAGAIVAVALIIGAVALMIARAGDSGAGQAAIRAGDDAASSVSGAANAPVRASANPVERLAGMWTAAGRVAELEAENRDLLAWKALAERLAERNARYEELLRMPPDAFGAGVDLNQAIAAQLVLDSGGPFTRTLVANAGADHGVRVGYIAVNAAGLIGRVVIVGRRSSRILMLDDYNSRIPVMGEASRVRAVIVGEATQPPQLQTRPFEMEKPRLDFVVGAAALRPGERIITSGDGGMFPRGLTVGEAQYVNGGWRVGLAASQQPIDFVRILPYVQPETPDAAPLPDPGPPAAARATGIGRVAELTAPPAAVATPRPAAPRPQPAATPTPEPAPAVPPAAPAAPAQPATPGPTE